MALGSGLNVSRSIKNYFHFFLLGRPHQVTAPQSCAVSAVNCARIQAVGIGKIHQAVIGLTVNLKRVRISSVSEPIRRSRPVNACSTVSPRFIRRRTVCSITP